MGRKDGKSTQEKGFRNPHNLPVKMCVVCGRPFNWRKKWEKCWDEVLTCSERCKRERRGQSRGKKCGGAAGAAAIATEAGRGEESDSEGDDSEQSDRDAVTKPTAKRAEPAPSNLSNSGASTEPGSTPRKDADADAAKDSSNECEEPRSVSELQAMDVAKVFINDYEETFSLSELMAENCRIMELSPTEERRHNRKQAAKAKKAERRENRSMGLKPNGTNNQKSCDECSMLVDLLVRCTTDESQQWRMLCGRCWTHASGGVPDGDDDHPHYRYGGLWKNRAAAIKTPSFGAKLNDVSAEA